MQTAPTPAADTTPRLARAVALRLFAAAALFALAGADIPLLVLGLTGTWLFLVTANRRTA
ncbi:hypothetical protein [Streptomyces bohaiensis]|uniref:hypothetical protein n=1 Tax=Streptomyces bohaiensis TaxID=1431344 RepID=UPI003B78C904